MTPLGRTIAGLAGGWLATRAIGLLEILQSGHAGTKARRLTSRRSFSRNAALASVAVVGLQVTGGFVWLLWPNKLGAFGQEITVSADNVPEVGGEPFRWPEGQFYLVHPEGEDVKALWWKCPHLGCTVPWIGGSGEFICPCHGSVYAYNGDRVSGPAPYGLNGMPVTIEEDSGNVIVDTNPATVMVDQY